MLVYRYTVRLSAIYTHHKNTLFFSLSEVFRVEPQHEGCQRVSFPVACDVVLRHVECSVVVVNGNGDGDAVSSGETTFFKVCDIKFGVLGVDDEGEDVISGFVLGFSGKEDSFFGNGLLC